jgi:hypothetical protein
MKYNLTWLCYRRKKVRLQNEDRARKANSSSKEGLCKPRISTSSKILKTSSYILPSHSTKCNIIKEHPTDIIQNQFNEPTLLLTSSLHIRFNIFLHLRPNSHVISFPHVSKIQFCMNFPSFIRITVIAEHSSETTLRSIRSCFISDQH